jgi:hypothetical protein
VSEAPLKVWPIPAVWALFSNRVTAATVFGVLMFPDESHDWEMSSSVGGAVRNQNVYFTAR